MYIRVDRGYNTCTVHIHIRVDRGYRGVDICPYIIQIEGTFQMDTPPFVIGYHNNTTDGIEGAYIQLFVSLEPALGILPPITEKVSLLCVILYIMEQGSFTVR